MSGKKRRWPAETNLAALKTLAHTLLWFDIQPTKLSPLVVKHPLRTADWSVSAMRTAACRLEICWMIPARSTPGGKT